MKNRQTSILRKKESKTMKNNDFKEKLREIRRRTKTILLNCDTSKTRGTTPNCDWLNDVERMMILRIHDLANPIEALVEICKTADKIMKDETAPTDIRGFVAFNYARLFWFKYLDNDSEELFRRRDDIPKDNYFRTVFVERYIENAIYSRFTEPLVKKAIKEGRLPAQNETEEEEKAYVAFFNANSQDYDPFFKQLANEYGEGHIESPSKQEPFNNYSQRLIPFDLRNEVDKLSEEWKQKVDNIFEEFEEEEKELEKAGRGDTPVS